MRKSKKLPNLVYVLGLASMAYLASLASMAENAKRPEITILFTNNNNGVLKHCGCPGNPQGSLAQRLAEIRRVQTLHPANLLLDGGDMFPLEIKDELKLSYFLNVIERFRYDAVALGEQDFGKGYVDVKRRVAEGRMPYLAVNVVDAETKQLVTKGFMTKMVGGVRCLVVGLVSPNAFSFVPEKLQEIMKSVEVRDPVIALTAVLAKERKEGDLVIVLSHMGAEEDQELAKRVTGVQVIVGGHSQTKMGEPKKIGDTYIVQAGKNNEHLGVMSVSVREGKLSDVRYEMISIDDRIKGLPEIEEIVEEFNKTQEQVMIISGAGGAPYEAARCMTCHQQPYRVWTESRHSHALDSLHRDTRRRSKECLVCHATGLPMPPVDPHQVQPAKMRVMGNVHCLACHRVEFPPDQIMHKRPVAAVTKEWCLTCHTKKDSPNFNFETYWPKIRHGL